MYARWSSFAVGLGLMLAPLVIGYHSVAPIVHDVAMGVLVCIATLAALEWPAARLVLAAPAVWLLLAGSGWSDPAAAAADVAAGTILLVLAAVPSARFAPPNLPRLPRRGRAGARA